MQLETAEAIVAGMHLLTTFIYIYLHYCVCEQKAYGL